MKSTDSSSSELWTSSFVRMTFANLLMFLSFHVLMPTFPFYVIQLGGDEATAGLANGLFAAAALLFRPISGWFVDNSGRMIIIVIGLAGLIVLPLSYIITPVLAIALIIRIIHGIFWSGASTSVNTVIADVLPKKRYAEGMGIFSLGTAISLAIGPLLGLSLLETTGLNPLFITSAVFALISLVLFYGIKHQDIENKRKLPSASHIFKNLFNKDALPASVTTIAYIFPFGAISTFVALYIVELGIGNGGIFFTVMAIITILTRLFTRKIADKYGETPIVVSSNLTLLVALLLLVFNPTYISIIISAIFYGFGIGMIPPTMQAMAMRIVPINQRGSAASTYLSAYDLGIGLGGVVAGFMIKYIGYAPMFATMTVFAILSLAVYFFWARKSSSSFYNYKKNSN